MVTGSGVPAGTPSLPSAGCPLCSASVTSVQVFTGVPLTATIRSPACRPGPAGLFGSDAAQSPALVFRQALTPPTAATGVL